MHKSHIALQPWSRQGDALEVAAAVEISRRTARAWFRVPAAFQDALTSHADPFLLGLIFPLMLAGDPVSIEGPISPSLIANLNLFMAQWHAWFPRLYRPIDIHASHESERPRAHAGDAPEAFLCPTSCGVDSSFTFLRHHHKRIGPRSLPIAAGTSVLGFDIPLSQNDADKAFADFQTQTRATLDAHGIPLIPMINNLRVFTYDWTDAHIAALLAQHLLLSKKYTGMILPNTIPLHSIHCRWGTHPLLDPYLTSRHFPIIDDGADVPRYEKLRLIAQYPDAFHRIHVCASTPGRFDNCGTCEKCIRTVLCCQILGIEPPRTFPRKPAPADILQLLLNHPVKIGFWRELCEGFDQAGLAHTENARAARQLLARGLRRQRRTTLLAPFIPLRNAIRRTFRGSEQNKSQAAQLQTITADVARYATHTPPHNIPPRPSPEAAPPRQPVVATAKLP